MQKKQNNTYEYFAFISYSSHDTRWGQRLQRKLEHYRMPAALCHERGWKRNPIDPVFFAPSDIQPGPLSPELQKKLKSSRHLIVVCSPYSARSFWVGEEIRYFHSLGRADRIHLFIVDGIPNSGNPDTECFHPVLKELGMPELLGANIHERIFRWSRMNRERAYVQLVTRLLDVSFDSIWQRHRRLLIQRIAGWITGGALVLAALATVWRMNLPVDVTFALNEATPVNTALPPLADARITLTLDNETKIDTISGSQDRALFQHVPHRFLSKPVHVTVECRDFRNVDTFLTLGTTNRIALHRDPKVYGAVRFRLWNGRIGKPITRTLIRVGSFTTCSDAEGYVCMEIPLEKQESVYLLASDIELSDNVLYMPCGENDIILAEP